jgi:hypothetical protein
MSSTSPMNPTSIDRDFLQEFVNFLDGRAFSGDADPQTMLHRTDLMVYALTTKLCSQIGPRVGFVDFKAMGGPGPIGPRPRLVQLIEYSMDAGTPELADAMRRTGGPVSAQRLG